MFSVPEAGAAAAAAAVFLAWGLQAARATQAAAPMNPIHLRIRLSPILTGRYRARNAALNAKPAGAPPMLLTWTALAPILLLVAYNLFMTFAWYGQLKVENR